MASMITNDEGYVAVKKYITIPQTLSVNGREYWFQNSANICMSWINPDDVNIVLSTTKTCCGGNKRHIFSLANEADVRRWTNGGGR